MGFPLSFLCSGRPIELDKPLTVFWLKLLKPFLQFKEQVPLNFKNKIPAV
jgi:hypothetical protein